MGFGLTAFSCWQMTHFDLQMDSSTIVWAGIAQGLGTGFVYVPLAAAAFATLQPTLRNEGTAIFNLSRNIGSSIGISVVETLLTRNTQIMHSALAEHVTSYMSGGPLPSGSALAGLNAAVTRQAAMIAYNDNFQLMLILCLAAAPFVILLRKGATKRSAEPVVLE
jgi:DHA2 family multidrug resistance protein